MMQRIVVISDTHGSKRALRNIILAYKDRAVCFIHCGDGEAEVLAMREEFPDVTIHGVCGNCDMYSQLPTANQVEVAGKSIFFTHGHMYGIHYDLDELERSAHNVNADIALYGHSHIAHIEYRDGLHLMNPGSPVQPRDNQASFGVIDIGDMGIVCNHVHYGG